MRSVHFFSTCLLAAVIVFVNITSGTQSAFGQTAAILTPSGTALNSYTNLTLGYDFTVGNTPLSVTSLGRWDGGNGLSTTQQVGIWTDDGNETFLGSVTIPAGTGTELNGWRYATLSSPILLAANTNYKAGASTTGDPVHMTGNTGDFPSPVFSTPDVTVIGRDYNNSSNFAHPNIPAPQSLVIAWDDPNFLYTEVVPEPASLSLLGIGGGLLLFVMSCKRSNYSWSIFHR
jgi:hypothetical protein